MCEREWGRGEVVSRQVCRVRIRCKWGEKRNARDKGQKRPALGLPDQREKRLDDVRGRRMLLGRRALVEGVRRQDEESGKSRRGGLKPAANGEPPKKVAAGARCVPCPRASTASLHGQMVRPSSVGVKFKPRFQSVRSSFR